MANTYLTRTPSSTGNQQKWTLSMWVKRGKLGVQTPIISTVQSSPSNTYDEMYFNTSDKFQFSTVYNNSQKAIRTTRVFRDTNAWYHIQFVYDTANSTVTDHAKLYINGVRETSFEDTTLLASGAAQWNSSWNKSGNPMRIGYQSTNTASYFNGSMSHIHFANNQAYAATVFGETDATTGEWKIKTSPSVTYGTNGFFILKDGNSVTDQSGNSNNFTVGGGTLTKTEDCPSNVFATLNPLTIGGTAVVLGNGNNSVVSGANNAEWYTASTIAPSTGKWYCELRNDFVSGQSADLIVGFTTNLEDRRGESFPGKQSWSLGLISAGTGEGNIIISNSSVATGYTSAWGVTNKILGIALDLDNKKIYFSLDGIWQSSANPSAGSGGYDFSSSLTAFEDNYFIAIGSNYNSLSANLCSMNFGNGYFGTTAVSSAGTNASGIGIFEYDVPTGYTALSTKGLNL